MTTVEQSKKGLCRLLCIASAIFTLGFAGPDEAEILKTLPREERVRQLLERTWEMTAAPVQGELTLDGRLDDPAWGFAEPVTDLYQGESNEGLPATERSDIRVLYDQTHLYIGFRSYDSEPDKANARAIFRDETPSADDLAIVMIDAYNDHRSSIQFVTNLNGVKVDLLQNGETPETRNRNWDTVWHSKGSRFEQGWDTEIAIPFKSLRFESPAQGEEVIFGIGFKRNIPRKNEEVTWPFVSNDSTWYRPAELGHLRGLKDIKPGRAVELKPYVLAGVDQYRDPSVRDQRTEFGGDVKWGVTPSLTADFTINTDFAQEEVDVQQINFTRFSLFFPEKRQFFLEGERMFQFGIQKEAEMVFTRRIGLSAGGEVIPITAGARLSGRQGRTSLGVMTIQADEAFTRPSENFTVIRLRRDFLSRASVGALFTSRQGDGNYNRVYGLDLSLPFKQVWTLEGYFARVNEPLKLTGRNSAYGRFAYETDRFGGEYRYLDLGENFRPGIGFVRRPNSREHFGMGRFSPRPSIHWIRQFHFKAGLRYITNQQNVLETREQGGEWTTALESGDNINLKLVNFNESITEPFALRPDVIVPPGTYNFSRVEASLNTFRRRYTVLNLEVATGGFWDGSRNTIAVGGNYRINTNLDISGEYEVNWIDLPQGAFTTHIFSGRLQIAFRKELVLMSLFQYNNVNHSLSSNIRFNWIPKPGSDFFIVYNELDDWGNMFQLKNRSLTAKLNYLFAF